MRKILSILTCLALLICMFGCNSQPDPDPDPDPDPEPIVRVEDTRNLSVYDYTVTNISATDREGRTVRTGDSEDRSSYVGLFYFVWQGYHTKNYGHINDITKLLAENPEALYDIEDNEASPLDEFYFWGEPLYGYYCAYDPWVLSRHVELFTMCGIDYLIYDLTNSVIYYDAITTMFEVLAQYRSQGWDVPKVAFYTNSHSAETVRAVYNYYYSKNLYSESWFSFGEKPLIIGRSNELGAGRNDQAILDFFDFRESQWPNGETSLDLENGFPWMEWNYPQNNYNGTMSVSLAQHPGAKMSEQDESNWGRGFDFTKFMNYSKNMELGTNFAGQWKTVFDNNADSSKQKINNVFVTGFNEWQAIKKEDGNKVFFVDTFNEEYSRDIEMMKGGYEDNYYLQLADYVKQFKFSEAKHYLVPKATMDLSEDGLDAWSSVHSVYRDFTGDARERNHADAFGVSTYVDQSNRNDIASVAVIHDDENLYVKIETVDPITAWNGSDLNWMNLLIKVDDDLTNSFAGFKYIVNRKPGSGKTSIEKSLGGYSWQDAGQADYAIYGNTMVLSVPLSALGLSGDDCRVQIKVSDNVTHYDDIMDYYVSGDSAPIGRLSYSYGY